MKSAFTLLELSIVLVIIGLIVGGVVAGQELIRNAELNSISMQKNQVVTAVNAFRSKYNALPGDMDNAAAYWGFANSGGAGGECADPLDNRGTGTQTCNGNGDGYISYGSSLSAGESWELYRFWQHLSNAKLLNGNYSGVSAATNSHDAHKPGVNSLAGNLGNSGWTTWSIGNFGNASYFSHNYDTLLYFGAATSGSLNFGPVLTAQEVASIDNKIDDGKPARGSVLVLYHTACTNSGGTSTDYDADYAVSSDALACAILFKNHF